MSFGCFPTPKMDRTSADDDFTFSLLCEEVPNTSRPTSPPPTPKFEVPLRQQEPLRQPEKAKKSYRRRRPASMPKWYVLFFAFGAVKTPTEREIKDIRSRQMRRQQWADPAVEEVCEGGRSGRKKAPWRLLRSLTCGQGSDVVSHYSAAARLVV